MPTRLMQELRSAGLNPAGVVDGRPIGDWEPDNAAVIAVIAAHEPDDAKYLSLDLEKHASGLKKLLKADQWAAYLAVQTTMIRDLRRAEYRAPGGVNDVMAEVKSDGGTDAAAKTAGSTAKASVQAKYPWPGAYR